MVITLRRTTVTHVCVVVSAFCCCECFSDFVIDRRRRIETKCPHSVDKMLLIRVF